MGPRYALVPLRQRRAINFELFGDCAVRERCAGLARFDHFNRSVNWVRIGGVTVR
jgi:hypothetical protein